MTQKSPVLSILTNESDQTIANQLANMLGYGFSHIVMGDGHSGANYIQQNQLSPSYILFVIGQRKEGVESELEALASHCLPGTKVVVAGQTNDIQFYRLLMDHGVLEYFTLPLDVADVARVFGRGSASDLGNSSAKVISFCSAAAGDGSSTIAINVAYYLAKEKAVDVVVIDMDYQYGMIAKHLDIGSPFGIKELLDHPDRGIDETLINRMVVRYKETLDIVAAPNGLHFFPMMQPEVIRELIMALSRKYEYIILDIPHIWTPWVSAAFNQSSMVFLTAQLWLKSVTHAARQLYAWKESGLNTNEVYIGINRSGAKFKEGVSAKDFERVCGRQIGFYFQNDIKTAAAAEQQGKTLMELKKTKLADEIKACSDFIYNHCNVAANP